MDNVISITQLFNQRLFNVPDYQRGYSWDSRQVREFLEDLDLLTPNRYHYTGTVVLHDPDPNDQRTDVEGNAYSTVDIVDGQQRLTTIVLLLDGVRRQLADLSESGRTLAEGITKRFVAAEEELNGQRLFKLSLNKDTDEFFKDSVLAEKPSVVGPQITSQQRLQDAKSQIAKYLSDNAGAMESGSEEWLRDLHKRVVNQLLFSLYVVDGEAEVGVIFEVMNDRGKPLTDLEKVKNYLLHASTFITVSNGLSKEVNSAWAYILGQLMVSGLTSPQDEDRLLRVHWLTHYNPQSRQWDGSRSIKGHFDLRKYKEEHNKLLGDLLVYAKGLRAACTSFCDAYRPKRDNAFQSFGVKPAIRSEVIKWSEKLVRVGVVATFLPMLMAVRERWPNDPDKYLQVLRLCEPLAFRLYRWQEARADAGQAALFRLGHDLATDESYTYEYAVQRLTSQISYWCREDDFHYIAANGNAYNWYNWRGLRYFLYEYELALTAEKRASPKVEWESLLSRDRQDTIEHILPQSINDQPYWESKFSPQDHQRYLHDLGNLTLTENNPALGNKSFLDKKGDVSTKEYCYIKSRLYVEMELVEKQDWDASAIEERRARLLAWARDRWAVDGDSAPDDSLQPDLIEDELDEDS